MGSATVSVAPVGVPPTELRHLTLEYLNSYNFTYENIHHRLHRRGRPFGTVGLRNWAREQRTGPCPRGRRTWAITHQRAYHYGSA